MLKLNRFSLKDVAELTGNTYDSVRTVLTRTGYDLPRWLMLAINITEHHHGIANLEMKKISPEELIEKIIQDDEFPCNEDRIECLIDNLNYGFEDHPLSPEKIQLVENLKSRLNEQP